MDALNNPYTPNAGAQPPVVVGRDEQVEKFDLLLGRLEKGRTAQSMIITGLRGVGKTVLLSEFRDRALKKDWVVLEIEAVKHDDQAFKTTFLYKIRECLFELSPKSKWSGKVKRLAAILSSFSVTVNPEGSLSLGLDVEPLEGRADTNIMSQDLTEVLIAVGEAAKEKERGVVLLIDEIQFLTRAQLEALITALHKTVQRKLPVTMVGAGLPQIAELLGDAKSYAERLFVFIEIGSLKEQDSKKALVDPAREEDVEIDDNALDKAISITEGYPYFLQEIGSAIWLQAEQSPITSEDVDNACDRYENKLDSSFFRVRLDRCTVLQRAYLRAMAELGSEPQSSAAVAHVMGREVINVASVRKQLIDMGLLYTPSYGVTAFTVPHFAQFMKRVEPKLIVPEKQTRKKRNDDKE
ncbi:AAA ATPase domain [Corynebacterium mustelae]|uniref:AAA ATPase domain n=1 Tax=Corynebacterium mustelae TaxID=571915 RepID=A0A0G3H884_9CORY|nr:ATP-binding protein [Corynebacterium mustelae]AKK07342.1 AAA ATPase domain [Corynebacterium mustelae]